MLEILVAFSPYYVAKDPEAAAPSSDSGNAAGPIDTYYNESLNEYSATTYDDLHGFIIDGLREWYREWQPDAEFDLDGAEEDAVQVPDAAGPASASVGYSTTRKTAGPAGGAAEGTPPPEPAAAGAKAATPATPK